MQRPSKRPYLVRALYEWMLACELTPYLAISANLEGVVVPRDLVADDRIVFNLSPTAVRNLVIGDAWVSFDGRFGGVRRAIRCPVGACVAIYAKETGEGMLFEADASGAPAPERPTAGDGRAPGTVPHLKVIK